MLVKAVPAPFSNRSSIVSSSTSESSSRPRCSRSIWSATSSCELASTPWAKAVVGSANCPPRLGYHAIESSRNALARASKSPSASTSAAKTLPGPMKFKPGEKTIECSVHDVPSPETFSCHARSRPASAAESASTSPSASRSAANTERAPDAFEKMVRAIHDVPSPEIAEFSYHEILPSNGKADITSTSPSSSTSAANTERAPPTVVAMVVEVHDPPSPVTFSCHAMFSDPDSASRSPSPSTSAANTARAEEASDAMVSTGHSAVLVGSRFSCQTSPHSAHPADNTSTSPSPSTSAADTEYGALVVVASVCAIHDKLTFNLFSSHAMPELAPEKGFKASTSPSPSTSAANTEEAPATVAMVRGVHDEPDPSRFSCHAVARPTENASRSPSPSTSAGNTDSTESAAVVMTTCSSSSALR